ncbi:MAG: ribosome silencing factor [Ezakiella sp.]|uniref:ribosome silencing factor n=1 Tax=Ezakiella sp. TaxID=1935205 RepID=UPI00297ADC7F|nr:ribosome silencing factor [Ezakiella sp.]MDD7731495.1 ribosome silencing factor [Eubacteriales bacterium]MDY6079310.1 ribosome silencing factor [Ezakiella sp.]
MENTDKKLEIIQKAIENKIGYDTEVIDIRGKASFSDYFVITSATSSNQMFAIADNVEYEMEKEGFEKLNNSAGKSNEWLLLDYDEVIVHIFDIKARKFYDLERLWTERDLKSNN